MNHTLKNILLVVLGVALLLLTFSAGLHVWGSWHDDWSGYTASLEFSNGWCNVAVIPLQGQLVAGVGSEEYVGGDDILSAIRTAEADSGLIGMLLRIDSPGGSISASETIAEALKSSPLPSAALIRETGTSAAYHAATGAGRIYASEFSDVGGIGVTMSYLQYAKQNEDSGLEFISLASAPYKDYGNPDTPLTLAERALIERDLAMYHAAFVRQVAENRGLPLETVESLADGSSVPGTLAVELTLVDEIGGQNDTRSWFAEQAQISPEDVVFCE